MSKRRLAYRWTLFAVTIAAVAWYLSRNIEQISRYPLEFDLTFIAGAWLAVLAAYISRFCVWLRLSAMLELRAPAVRAARAYFISILGRYVPGKLGLALLRAEAYGGCPTDRVIVATAMELVAALAAAFLLASIGLAFMPARIPGLLRWLPPVCIIPLAALLHPVPLRRTANWFLTLTGHARLERVPSFGANMGVALLYTLPGLLHGAGLFLLLYMLAPLPVSYYPAVTGVYYMANLVGLVAFFAPGGLGVREGMLFMILPLLVGMGPAIIAALMIRLVTLAAEIALAAIFSLTVWMRDRRHFSRFFRK